MLTKGGKVRGTKLAYSETLCGVIGDCLQCGKHFLCGGWPEQEIKDGPCCKGAGSQLGKMHKKTSLYNLRFNKTNVRGGESY